MSSILRSFGTRPLAALALALLAACGGESSTGTRTPDRPAAVAAVAVTPDTHTLDVGGSVAITAVALDAAGRALAGRAIAFASDDATIATVSDAGIVTGVAAGTVRISATSEGKRAHAAITVAAPPPRTVDRVTVDLTAWTMLEGATRRLVATAYDADGVAIPGLAIHWATSDALVATVGQDGTVTAVRWGNATITASVGGKDATTAIQVGVDYAYDLVFDQLPGDGGLAEMYRLDIRLAGNAPVRVVPERGAWSATASPDGSMIAFTCAQDGPAICVANRDGSGVRVLTTGSANEDQPAWSPDGTRIAFRRWPAGGPPGPFNRADIWVMNADGSNQVNLTADASARVWHSSPAWSPRQPDGSYRIAYARLAQPVSYAIGRIQSMRADGGDKRLVTSGGEYVEDEPAWSPDGTTIVFVRTGGTAAGDLWLVDVAGGQERPLMPNDPADDQRSPRWSPDGRFIAFTSKHELTWGTRWVYQLYTVRADGTDLTRRSNEGKDVEHPAWLVR